jgi:hypothetical protein
MVNVYGEVTLYVKRGTEDALKAKAKECDEDPSWGMCEVPEDGYTLEQALQVVWHADPEWLHKNVLEGWTLDKAGVESTPQSIWPDRTQPKED